MGNDDTDAQILHAFSSNSEQRSPQRGAFRATRTQGLRDKELRQIRIDSHFVATQLVLCDQSRLLGAGSYHVCSARKYRPWQRSVGKLTTFSLRFWDGGIATLSFAVALCICDALYVASWQLSGSQVPVGVAFAVELWWLVVALLPVAIALGAILAAAGRRPEHTGLNAALGWLTSGSDSERVSRAAALTAGILLFAAGSAGGGLASFAINRRVVQDHFTAIATALAFGGIAVLAGLIYPLIRRAFVGVFSAVAPLALIGWPLRAPLRVLIAVCAVAAGVLAWVFIERWQSTLQYAPWSILLRVSGALILALVFYQGWRSVRDRPHLRGLVSLILVLGLALLSIPALRLEPFDWVVRRTAFVDSVGGTLARKVLRGAFDRDHDGFVSFMGDGDCGPADPSIYYGAPETAGNSIDEDCDGQDVTTTAASLCTTTRQEVSDGVPKTPDVILITVDALAAARMGIMGYARPTTRNLDAFARKSMYFDSAFAQGPSTRLSFPAIFTSKWDSLIRRDPQNHHLPYSLEEEETQLAEVLRGAGYETAAIIPDRNFVPSYWPSATRGFSIVDDSPVHARSGHNAAEVTKRALDLLHRERTKPLFMWVHYYDPHSPYHQPAGVTRFGASDSDIYDAEVLYTDTSVGPLLEALTARPNTLTIVTADHGTVFHPQPQTRRARYGYDVYTATLHVPLLFHAPFLKPRVWSGVVSTLDIYPTIADLLRLEPPGALCGSSLAQILLGSDPPPRGPTFHEFYLPERALRDNEDALVKVAVRNDKYNLVFNCQEGSYELYDWRDDYYEMKNLMHSHEHRHAFDALQETLLSFIRAANPGRQ